MIYNLLVLLTIFLLLFNILDFKINKYFINGKYFKNILLFYRLMYILVLSLN